MNLLVITQKIDINDDTLGFFHNWIYKFSQKVDKLFVIVLQKGEYHLPKNVVVLSLGKERYKDYLPSFLLKTIYLLRFYRYIWQFRKEYDNVFIHMNSVYVIMGGLFWKIFRKRIGLWYAHIKVSFLTKISVYFVDFIFSPSKASFKFITPKLKETGHGIDINIFKPSVIRKNQGNRYNLISVGRISQVKNYDVLIRAVKILARQKKFKDRFSVKIIGAPIYQRDYEYLKKLKKKIRYYHLDSYFHWLGSVPNKNIIKFYRQGDIFICMQCQGGFAKSVLEAMSCGLICIVCSPVYTIDKFSEELVFQADDPFSLAEKIGNVFNWPKKKLKEYQYLAINYVKDNHNLDTLINRILSFYESKYI